MRAVCLDMDGTLVDSEKLWDVAVFELAEHMGRPLDEATRRRTLGASLQGFFDILAEYTGHPMGDGEFERLSTMLHERVTGLMATDLEWRPGAREFLDSLAADGIRLALVTNTDAGVADLPIDFIGRDRFEVIVTGDRAARPKPAPDPYLLACELLEVPPVETVAVEDSPTGARSAVEAGCRVVYIPSDPPQPPVEGTVEITTLVGVDAAGLDRLTAGRDARGPVGESPA